MVISDLPRTTNTSPSHVHWFAGYRESAPPRRELHCSQRELAVVDMNIFILLFYPIVITAFPQVFSLITQNSTNSSTSYTISPRGSTCRNLLRTTAGTHHLKFPDDTTCLRLQNPSASIPPLRKLPYPSTFYISRHHLRTICNGHCVLQHTPFSVIVSTRQNTLYTINRRNGPFFYPLLSQPYRLPSSAFIPLSLLFLLISFRSARLIPPFLFLLSYLLFLKPNYVLLQPRLPPSEDKLFHGFVLKSFRIQALHLATTHRHTAQCAIFTCNAFSNVKNLRLQTFTAPYCDVLNFRITQIFKYNVPHIAITNNWLKVIIALYLLSHHKNYEIITYIDRDLILEQNPPFFTSIPVTFPDLGNSQPDAAMFVLNTTSSLSNTFLQTWSSYIGMPTSRHDKGEEQDALLNISRTTAVHVVRSLYTFQCGRNSLNRAQCLLRRDWVTFNSPIILAKVSVELLRTCIHILLSPTATKHPTWLTPFARIVSLLDSRRFLAEIVSISGGILEISLYIAILGQNVQKNMKCSLEAVKSISSGSFDNPVERTFIGISEHGFSKREPTGWRCFRWGMPTEKWAKRELDDVQSFLVAIIVAVSVSAVIPIPKLCLLEGNLNPAGGYRKVE